jgi:hypothetical protein
MDSVKDVGRRNFFMGFAKVAGVAALAAGGLAAKPSTAEAFFFGPQIDPRWKGLVANLKEYVIRTYVKFDMDKARAALQALEVYGIKEQDVTPLQNVNRILLPKEMFLTHYYVESAAAIPATKLFKIEKRSVFDGFVVDGRRRTTLFGRPLDTYDRVLLGEEIFSTIDAPPVALPYNLADYGSPKPAWVIAIPYGWIHDLYGGFGKSTTTVEERLVEELTIHEITHIVHQTREELLPFLAQFGYRMDDNRSVTSVDDLVDYMRSTPATYHQTERLILERIDNADHWYGSSGNVGHLVALRQIRDGLVRLAKKINTHDSAYPVNLLKFSDQQCYSSMAYLYTRAADRYASHGTLLAVPLAV